VEKNIEESNPVAKSQNASLKIGLIGCGAIAETYYLPALSRYPGLMANLILVDRDENQLEKNAQKYHLENTLRDFQELPENMDGVIIALPTHLHLPVAKALLNQGIPVLCEKPLADNAQHAREMIECAENNGVSLATNYLQRLIPSFKKVKEILTQKMIGDPVFIKYRVGESFDWPTTSGFYFNSSLAGRGILRDRGAHSIDHICWWLGGKPEVTNSRNDSFGGSEAVAFVNYKYGICEGEMLLSWLSTFPSTYKIVCEKGTIEGDVYDYLHLNLVIGATRKRMNLPAKEKTKLDIANTILLNFIDVICNGTKPLIAGADVLDSLEFIDECYSKVTQFEMPWYERHEVIDA
jgi:predicted dehydrogenase